MKKYKNIDFFEDKLKLDSDEGTPSQVPPGYSRSGDPKGAPSATTPGGPGVNPGDGTSPSSGDPKGAPSATTPGGPSPSGGPGVNPGDGASPSSGGPGVNPVDGTSPSSGGPA